MATFQFEPLAEGALLLRFGEHIDIDVNADVAAATACLQRELPQVECVPAYASLLLRFEPLAWMPSTGESADPHQQLRKAVQAALSTPAVDLAATHEHVIPVCYGGGYGPDLDDVARHSGLDRDTVISHHVAADYRVGMIGFAPGFPYLLGLDQALAMPRRSDPRQRVPAGSVGIGGQQTGIYPRELPGGWQLIGRTPLHLFDPTAGSPSLLAPGDRVRFKVIDEGAFTRLQAEQNR
jgi:KipI family sensor histidine kinase inhibitor